LLLQSDIDVISLDVIGLPPQSVERALDQGPGEGSPLLIVAHDINSSKNGLLDQFGLSCARVEEVSLDERLNAVRQVCYKIYKNALDVKRQAILLLCQLSRQGLILAGRCLASVILRDGGPSGQKAHPVLTKNNGSEMLPVRSTAVHGAGSTCSGKQGFYHKMD